MRPTKIMLLGIAIMLIAVYIPHEPGFRTGGYELYILAIGFILVIVGYFKEN